MSAINKAGIVAIMLGLVLPVFSQNNLDKAFVKVNGEKKGTWIEDEKEPVVQVKTQTKTDSVEIEVWTDWGGLEHSTLDIKDEEGNLITQISGYDTGDEAHFNFVPASVRTNVKTWVVYLNYNPRNKVKPHRMAKLVLE